MSLTSTPLNHHFWWATDIPLLESTNTNIPVTYKLHHYFFIWGCYHVNYAFTCHIWQFWTTSALWTAATLLVLFFRWVNSTFHCQLSTLHCKVNQSTQTSKNTVFSKQPYKFLVWLWPLESQFTGGCSASQHPHLISLHNSTQSCTIYTTSGKTKCNTHNNNYD